MADGGTDLKASIARPHGPTHDERRDLLAYGTQIVLDGRAADRSRMASLELAESFVRETLASIEPNVKPLVRTHETTEGLGPGVSAVARYSETGVMVHTFIFIGRLTVRLVSSRSVPVDEARRRFVEAFGVGRHQTHVTARFRTMALLPEILERQLLGERDYARVRLTERLKL